MTQLELLNRAYMGALESWSNEFDKLKKDPANLITKERERKLWKEVEELRNMAIEEERRENEETL